MKPIDRALRDAAKVGDTLADVATSYGKQALALASGEVVAGGWRWVPRPWSIR